MKNKIKSYILCRLYNLPFHLFCALTQHKCQFVPRGLCRWSQNDAGTRPEYMAEVWYSTSRLNHFLIFLGKERTNVAAHRGAKIRNNNLSAFVVPLLNEQPKEAWRWKYLHAATFSGYFLTSFPVPNKTVIVLFAWNWSSRESYRRSECLIWDWRDCSWLCQKGQKGIPVVKIEWYQKQKQKNISREPKRISITGLIVRKSWKRAALLCFTVWVLWRQA